MSGAIRGLPAPPRPAPHDPAPPDQLPGERLGDEGPRGPGGHQPVRGGQPPAGCRAGRLRRVRPVRGSDQWPRRYVLRRPDRQPRQLRRDLRPGPPPDRDRGHPRARDPGPRAGDDRRHPGAAVLDEERVALVQRRRLGGHQHDPVPRGIPVPRARDGRRQHQPDHRLRRRRPRGHRGGQRDERARGLRAQCRPDPEGRARDDPALPGRSRGARGRGMLEFTRGDGHATSPEDIRLFETGL